MEDIRMLRSDQNNEEDVVKRIIYNIEVSL